MKDIDEIVKVIKTIVKVCQFKDMKCKQNLENLLK